MKYCLLLIYATFIIVLLAMPVAALSAADIVSDTAVLIDMETGQVLFDKGMHRRMFPASTTKVMTALLVCESSDPDEIVTVSEQAVIFEDWPSSHIALQPGEEVTVDELLYALILPSANDAANALAEHVAGSQEAFAEMMTEKAREIGAVNTRFTNAHGLHNSSHYTTAYDMALITAYAMQNESFRTYFGTPLHTMPPTNLQEDERYFTNMQYMVVEETSYYNKDVLGGKVGYTEEGKHTMTTAAKRGDRSLVCVVFRSTNRWEKFRDTQTLLDYGFREFRRITLPAEAFASDTVLVGDQQVMFYSDSEFTALLHRDIRENRVQVQYQLAEHYETTDMLPDSVEIVIRSEGRTMPSLLGTQPIRNNLPEVDAVATAALSGLEPATGPDSMPNRLLWKIGAIIVVVLLIAGFVFFSWHLRLQKRRRKRLQQLRRMRGKTPPRKSA